MGGRQESFRGKWGAAQKPRYWDWGRVTVWREFSKDVSKLWHEIPSFLTSSSKTTVKMEVIFQGFWSLLMHSFDCNTALKGTKVEKKAMQVFTDPTISLPAAGLRFQARLPTRRFIMA